MSGKFVVYKSSAGSGKTTTLVKEYLKLALAHPGNFGRILAVTFTNKAANEMKTRILENLKSMSKGDWEESGAQAVLNEMHLSPGQLSERASRLLQNIIHNYDDFAVSTIDSFIHQIVRTFSSDLKLPQGFEVLIDQDDIVPFIVEEIYDKPGHDKAFTDILLQYVLSLVDDEKSYDLDQNLTKFVSKQLNETGEEAETEYLSPADFAVKIKALDEVIGQYKKRIQSLAQEGLKMIADAGLSPGDFKGGGNGVGGYLLKIKEWPADFTKLAEGKTVTHTLENDEWYSKSQKTAVKETIDALVPLLKPIFSAIREAIRPYIFLRLVKKNIYEMALIGEIHRLFEAFTLNTHKVHISEFNKRIHKEIANQPVPFIYERLGRRYRHFLIDEFQDTSVLQWENLLPMFEESLANGHFNMVVGDAKQAIYRFRHGEVELFTHLPHLYGVEPSDQNKLREQVLVRNYTEKNLRYNYRSRQEIIDFNNRFFQWAGQTLPGGFADIYKDVEQTVPEPVKTGGYVSIDFVEAEKTEEYRQRRLDKIRETITFLLNKNYPLQDICILTLKNDSAAQIAAFLLQNDIPVITSESLLLTASPAVRLVVAVLKIINDGDNPFNLAEFLLNLLKIRGEEQDFHSCYQEAVTRDNPFQYLLSKYGLTIPSWETLRTRSLYEMVIEIIRYLLPANASDPFLLFFLDFVFEKEPVYYGSLPAFLKLWEEKKEKQSIVFPEGLEAIQIMTAHKAKGLKFGAVIADLYETNNKLTKQQYWEKPEIPELKDFSRVLLNISRKQLELIGKQNVYEKERAKTDLDFMNKVYVAFTRPVDGLFIISSRMTRDAFSQKVTEYLKAADCFNEEVLHYQWGSFPESVPAAEKNKQVETLSEGQVASWFEFLEIAPVEEVYWASAGKKSPRTFGKLLHSLLSKIKYSEEADPLIKSWVYSGVLEQHEADEIKQMVERILQHPELESYFGHDVSIKTETDLFDAQTGRFKRPDRVVLRDDELTILDYKTGAREPETEKKYRKQVTDYAAIYARMGYRNVQKRLVYIQPDHVEVVEV